MLRLLREISAQRDVLKFADLAGEMARLPYPDGYVVSKRWRVRLDEAINRAGRSSLALARLSLELFDVALETVGPERAAWFKQSRAGFISKYPELAALGESAIHPREGVAEIDGITFSAKMEQAFSYYADIKSAIGSLDSIKTIVEVGAGYGRMARIMKLLDPSRCYVLVDLPEALVFSYAFLRKNFPQARLAVFDGTATDPRADFVFCPVQLLRHLELGSVDLFINTYSLAEMRQACVDYIVGCVENVVRPRYLFSLNMAFTDKSQHFDTGGLDGEANDTCLPVSPMWWPERFVLIPDLVPPERITASVVLRQVSLSRDDLVRGLLEASSADSPHRLGQLYLATLWSRSPDLVDRFRTELRDFYARSGFSSERFEHIGELMRLRA